MINRRMFLQMIGLGGVPAKDKILNRYNPPHNSLQTERLNRMPERVYAEAWKKKNKRDSVINHGFTFLEWILAPRGGWPVIPCTDRDAEVAASVIQWLGTNCGLGFMMDCESEISRCHQRGN